MTSAMVTIFKIYDSNGVCVGSHRQHALCATRWEELDKFQPYEDFRIQATGLDEHEAPWGNRPMNLRTFLEEKGVLERTKPKETLYRATVEIAFFAENAADACDAVSAMLTENLQQCEALFDWQYMIINGQWSDPKDTTVGKLEAASLDEGEVFEL